MSRLHTTEMQHKLDLILSDTSRQSIQALCDIQGITKHALDYNVKKYGREVEYTTLKERKLNQGVYSKYTPEEEKQILNMYTQQKNQGLPLDVILKQIGVNDLYLRKLAKKHNVPYGTRLTQQERRAILEQYNTDRLKGVPLTEALCRTGVHNATLIQWFKEENISRVTRKDILLANAKSLIATVNHRLSEGEYLTHIARDLKISVAKLNTLSDQISIPLNANPRLTDDERKMVLYEANKLLNVSKTLKEVAKLLGVSVGTLHNWSTRYNTPLNYTKPVVEPLAEEKLSIIAEFNRLVEGGLTKSAASHQVGYTTHILRRWFTELDLKWVLGARKYTVAEQDNILATILPKLATGASLHSACKESAVKSDRVIKWLHNRNICIADYTLPVQLERREEKVRIITEYKALVAGGLTMKEASQQLGYTTSKLRKWAVAVNMEWVIEFPSYEEAMKDTLITTILPRVATGTPFSVACKDCGVAPSTVGNWLKSRNICRDDYFLQEKLLKGRQIYTALVNGQQLKDICNELTGVTTKAGRKLLDLFINHQLSTKEMKDV